MDDVQKIILTKEPIVSVSNIAKGDDMSKQGSVRTAPKTATSSTSLAFILSTKNVSKQETLKSNLGCTASSDYGKLESKVDSHGFMFHGIIINPHRSQQPGPNTLLTKSTKQSKRRLALNQV